MIAVGSRWRRFAGRPFLAGGYQPDDDRPEPTTPPAGGGQAYAYPFTDPEYRRRHLEEMGRNAPSTPPPPPPPPSGARVRPPAIGDLADAIRELARAIERSKPDE